MGGSLRWSFALVALAGPVAGATAQSPPDRTVAGTVIDQGTRQPLLGARVTIVGSARWAQTDTRGAFQVAGLAGDQVTVEVVRVGYRRLVQAVRVGTTNLELALVAQVIKLDELV